MTNSQSAWPRALSIASTGWTAIGVATLVSALLVALPEPVTWLNPTLTMASAVALWLFGIACQLAASRLAAASERYDDGPTVSY